MLQSVLASTPGGGPGSDTTAARIVDLYDDPANVSGLGAPAVLRGTVQAHKCAGVTVGAGQATAVRQATAAGLQAAIVYAAAQKKFFEIEPNIYEIDTALGLTIPTALVGSDFNDFCWKGTPGTRIEQFHTNAPILTVGDPTSQTYAADQIIDGATLDYGVDQTGQPNAIGLLLGAMTACTIANIQSCFYSRSNPPWIGMSMNADPSGPRSFFYQNTVRNCRIGGAQQSLWQIRTGGTGNLFMDIYTINGGSYADQLPTIGPAWDFAQTYAQCLDNTFLRCNIEHVKAPWLISMAQFHNTRMIGTHIEACEIQAGGSGVILISSGLNTAFDNTCMQDVGSVANLTGGNQPAFITVAGYDEFPAFADLYINYLNYGAGQPTLLAKTNSPFKLISYRAPNGDDYNASVRIDNLTVTDYTNSNMANFAFDTYDFFVPWNSRLKVREYKGDPYTATTVGLQAEISSDYTHYAHHQKSFLLVPAALGGDVNVTLSNNLYAGFGTNFANLKASAGDFIRIRRERGTAAHNLIVKDAASSTVLTTNTTADVNLYFQFNGTNWVAL